MLFRSELMGRGCPDADVLGFQALGSQGPA